MKQRKKLAFILAFTMIVMCVPMSATKHSQATCASGIKNNGTAGITIDINSSPYTDYANISNWGQYAYGQSGCAWFASARVRQLTGKGTTIWSGQSWYDSAYASCGFSRGQAIRAGSLLCWSGHVAVCEKIDGGTAYISEGGSTYYSDAAHGYCIIRSVSVSSVAGLNSGFLGCVYFGSGSTNQTVYGFDSPRSGETVVDTNNFRFGGWVEANKQIKSITCSINRGERYVEALLYKREDVPNATAFLADISSSFLRMGSNEVALCVTYTDGTAETLSENRPITKVSSINSYGYDSPAHMSTISDTTWKFGGWIDSKKTIKRAICSINQGQKYFDATLYKRDDVPDATAFQIFIDSSQLAYGTNRVALCAEYTDGSTVIIDESRLVNKCFHQAIDYPKHNETYTGESVHLEGWSLFDNKTVGKFAVKLNGEEKYNLTPYKRSDLLDNSGAYIFDIPGEDLVIGSNTVDLTVYYTDGSQMNMGYRVFEYRKEIFTPTIAPTLEPTTKPTEEPVIEPTTKPTEEPVIKPTGEPASESTAKPTEQPAKPTVAPTKTPTTPTAKPSLPSGIHLPINSSTYDEVKAPAKVSGLKVKALKKGKVKVSWTWKADQNGYQVQYAMNKSFSKKAKTINKGAYTDAMEIKKLKKKKTYYVRVRAYKKDGYLKKYGQWSSTKKCKVK